MSVFSVSPPAPAGARSLAAVARFPRTAVSMSCVAALLLLGACGGGNSASTSAMSSADDSAVGAVSGLTDDPRSPTAQQAEAFATKSVAIPAAVTMPQLPSPALPPGAAAASAPVVAAAPAPMTAPVAAPVAAPAPATTPTSMPAPVAAPAPMVLPTKSESLPVDAAAITVREAGFSELRVRPTAEIAPGSDIGAFRTTCSYSHMGYDDPIVFPGQPGRGHLHTFFGNTQVTAATTAESLRQSGNSTCRGGIANRSSYWVPTIVDTSSGKPVAPTVGNFYYKRGYEISTTTTIAAPPAGLRMIAGDAARTTPGGSFSFHCEDQKKELSSARSELSSCPAGTGYVLSTLTFPNCWDGKNLDSPDHKSHMSYVVQDQSAPFAKHCPDTHPIAIPVIQFNIWYPVGPNGTATWRLSSDLYSATSPSGYSMHGDWFNGWDPSTSTAWARSCINALKDCHSHLLGDGREIY